MVYGLTGCKSAAPLPQKAQAAGSRPVAIAPDTANVPKEIVNLPVFIPAAELQNRLYQLFLRPTMVNTTPAMATAIAATHIRTCMWKNPIYIYTTALSP